MVVALLMVHEELTVTCTGNIKVAVEVALERSAKAKQDKAATVNVSLRRAAKD